MGYSYPPRPELSAFTTPTQNMAATAASIALPPSSIISSPILEHSSTSVATAAFAPIYRNSNAGISLMLISVRM